MQINKYVGIGIGIIGIILLSIILAQVKPFNLTTPSTSNYILEDMEIEDVYLQLKRDQVKINFQESYTKSNPPSRDPSKYTANDFKSKCTSNGYEFISWTSTGSGGSYNKGYYEWQVTCWTPYATAGTVSLADPYIADQNITKLKLNDYKELNGGQIKAFLVVNGEEKGEFGSDNSISEEIMEGDTYNVKYYVNRATSDTPKLSYLFNLEINETQNSANDPQQGSGNSIGALLSQPYIIGIILLVIISAVFMFRRKKK